MSTPTSTILITGGTAGLGYEAALAVAKQQPSSRIILCSRTNPSNADTQIRKLTGHTNVVFQPLDLGSLEAIRAFATAYAQQKNPPISTLLLNAGLQFPGDIVYSKDGYEMTFGVNHLGHALLYHLLYTHLAPAARVVVTASGTHDPMQKTGIPDAHYTSAEELARPTGDMLKAGRGHYSNSKLCNVMWTYALHRRLSDSKMSDSKNITVSAFDPGFVPATGLARDANFLVRFIVTQILPRVLPLLRLLAGPNVHTPQESGGALAQVALGKAGDVNGKYTEGTKPIDSSKESYEVEKQEDLWRWTAEVLARDAEEKMVIERGA